MAGLVALAGSRYAKVEFLPDRENRVSSPKDAPRSSDLLTMTADVVAAFLGRTPTPQHLLPDVIQTVHRTLAGLQGRAPSVESEPPRPAVAVKKSVQPDYLVCLEDGKKLRMLKRYLRTTYGMTPEQYRSKWGLPPDYPMVAPNYARQRSVFAKTIGLGKSAGPRKSRRRG
jgi:predicted transcriptional regulator